MTGEHEKRLSCCHHRSFAPYLPPLRVHRQTRTPTKQCRLQHSRCSGKPPISFEGPTRGGSTSATRSGEGQLEQDATFSWPTVHFPATLERVSQHASLDATRLRAYLSGINTTFFFKSLQRRAGLQPPPSITRSEFPSFVWRPILSRDVS